MGYSGIDADRLPCHEHVEGSEALGAREGTTYRGAAVVAYPIQRHFDLKPSYSSRTGIEQRAEREGSDRPWNEREYIRGLVEKHDRRCDLLAR